MARKESVQEYGSTALSSSTTILVPGTNHQLRCTIQTQRFSCAGMFVIANFPHNSGVGPRCSRRPRLVPSNTYVMTAVIRYVIIHNPQGVEAPMVRKEDSLEG